MASLYERPLEILLIEDNPADADLIRETIALREKPLNLHVLKTGEEALHFLSRSGPFQNALRPDLILLDLNLPGMDGREVLERIKAELRLKQIPVIVLTSAQADLDVLKSYSAGASCYILKPVDPDLFAQVISQIQDFWFSLVQLPNHVMSERGKSSHSLLAQPLLPRRASDQPLHVLYVEDRDADAEKVLQDLTHLSEPQVIAHREIRLADAFQYLANHSVDVVLLDLRLPDSEGFETVRRFHANSPFVPFVVLTGNEEKALGIRAVKEGADDYLVKSQIQGELLGRTLLHAIERKAGQLRQLDALSRERVARSEAETALGIRDEFVSIAGHELRHPLTALKMRLHLLITALQTGVKDTLSHELAHKMAQKADVEVDRFGKLIDTLVNTSHIQSGRLKLEYSRFDLNETVRESVERFAPELKNAGCEVILNLGAPVEGEWDSLRVEQVLMNLLSNGIKYAPGKPITISVTAEIDKVWIRFTDQGPGIAAQDQERIFQRFERAQVKNAVSGLGLGLYVVRQIIDTHGGSIFVKSELGRGATFNVCLPRQANGRVA